MEQQGGEKFIQLSETREISNVHENRPQEMCKTIGMCRTNFAGSRIVLECVGRGVFVGPYLH